MHVGGDDGFPVSAHMSAEDFQAHSRGAEGAKDSHAEGRITLTQNCLPQKAVFRWLKPLQCDFKVSTAFRLDIWRVPKVSLTFSGVPLARFIPTAGLPAPVKDKNAVIQNPWRLNARRGKQWLASLGA